ncbi:hypothetical protein D9M68_818980 [compost metagenome]
MAERCLRFMVKLLGGLWNGGSNPLVGLRWESRCAFPGDEFLTTKTTFSEPPDYKVVIPCWHGICDHSRLIGQPLCELSDACPCRRR